MVTILYGLDGAVLWIPFELGARHQENLEKT
jgi:hypothetical protein